jgi:hypothetical protein
MDPLPVTCPHWLRPIMIIDLTHPLAFLPLPGGLQSRTRPGASRQQDKRALLRDSHLTPTEPLPRDRLYVGLRALAALSVESMRRATGSPSGTTRLMFPTSIRKSASRTGTVSKPLHRLAPDWPGSLLAVRLSRGAAPFIAPPVGTNVPHIDTGSHERIPDESNSQAMWRNILCRIPRCSDNSAPV